MRHAICFDISTKTGWSRWGNDMRCPASGTRVFDTSNREGVREHEMRNFFQRMIGTTFPEGRIEVVVKEAPIGPAGGRTNFDTLVLLNHMDRMVAEVCVSNNVKVVTWTVGAWRELALPGVKPPARFKGPKFYIERRKFWKATAMAKCRELGWNPANDDEAEAQLMSHAYRRSTDHAYDLAHTGLFAAVPA